MRTLPAAVMSWADTHLPIGYKPRRLLGALGVSWAVLNLFGYGAVLGAGLGLQWQYQVSLLLNACFSLVLVWQMPYRICQNCGHQRGA